MHLERLTSILEIVGQKEEATVAEICAHSDLPKPSAYRLVQDLVGIGLLEPVARGYFTIGTRLKKITNSDHSDRALLDLIAPGLKQAASQFDAALNCDPDNKTRGRHQEPQEFASDRSRPAHAHRVPPSRRGARAALH